MRPIRRLREVNDPGRLRYRLELQLLDTRGEVVARGVSGEPLSFTATIGEDGRALQYRLEILPSPEFEPGNEYPFTAGVSDPGLG